MPSRKTILTVLVVAVFMTVAGLVSAQLGDPWARALAVGSGVLFSLALIRSQLLMPVLWMRRWQRYAGERGYKVALTRYGEPFMVGTLADVTFTLAQSTRLLGGGAGYYARTSATAHIQHGVPDGLRLYRHDTLEWAHQLSGLRQVETGDKILDETLMIEGSDAEETRAWVLERRNQLMDLADRYPRFIVFGAEVEGLPVDAGGASGAITVLLVGRKSRPAELDTIIELVCGCAERLG